MQKLFLGTLVGTLLTASFFAFYLLNQKEDRWVEFDAEKPINNRSSSGRTSELQSWLSVGASESDDRANRVVDGKPLIFHFLDQTKTGSSSHLLVLLKMGADPNQTYEGITPLQLSIEQKNYLNSVLLVEFGASLEDQETIRYALDSLPEDDNLAKRIRAFMEWKLSEPPMPALTFHDLHVGIP